IVSRILDPDSVARLQQATDDEAERALEAAGDEDLFGRAGYAARDCQVAGDLNAQRLVAGGRLVAEIDGAQRTRLTREQARPDLVREGIERRESHPEERRRAERRVGSRQRRCLRGAGRTA